MTDYFISSVADATATPEAPSGYDIGVDTNDGLSPIDLGGGVGPKLTMDFAQAIDNQDGNTFYVNGEIDVSLSYRMRGSCSWQPSGNSQPSRIKTTTGLSTGIFSWNTLTTAYNGKTHVIGALELSESLCTNGVLYLVGNSTPGNATLTMNGTKFIDCNNKTWRGSGSSAVGGDIIANNISFEGTPAGMGSIIDSVGVENGADITLDGVHFDVTNSGEFNNGQGGINVYAQDPGSAFTLRNVTGSISFATSSAITMRGISAKEFTTYDVSNVDYTLTDTLDTIGFADGMFLQSVINPSTQTKIRTFDAAVNCSNGHHYLIGLDGGLAAMSGIDIDGTNTSGPIGLASGTLHGPSIGGTQGGTIKNVTSDYANIGLLTKENTGLLTVTNCQVNHAIGRGYYDKGSSVAPAFTNNVINISTGYTCGAPGAAALNAGSTDNNDPSLGAQFNSNLVLIEAGTTGTITLADVEQDVGSGASTATFTNNNYWFDGDVIPDTFNYQGATNLSLEGWNLLAEVTNDKSEDPYLGDIPDYSSKSFTSEQALLKANMRFGGLDFKLKPNDMTLLNDACGVITPAATIEVAGDVSLVGPYRWPIGTTVTITTTGVVSSYTLVTTNAVDDTGTILNNLLQGLSFDNPDVISERKNADNVSQARYNISTKSGDAIVVATFTIS